MMNHTDPHHGSSQGSATRPAGQPPFVPSQLGGAPAPQGGIGGPATPTRAPQSAPPSVVVSPSAPVGPIMARGVATPCD